MSDPVFVEEQQHLSDTYQKLRDIERALAKQLEKSLAEALADKENMLDDLAVDFGNGVNLETYVEFEAMHQVIDAYNQTNDIREIELKKAQLLQHRPYFAKVTLQFSPDAPARDVYIGAAGMTDEMQRHFIIDWRSPVAEVYYNQENGHTSYVANGRTIDVDLKLRRQFDIDRDRLNSYFDTTIAIQDPLLLKSLRRERGGKLKDITATIQKEQNTVIRHEDVPALLVAGIAGSGKTSVLLQRIAYLFYRQRENLRPSDVYLISPNEVFAHYIDNVLPDMGESNPVAITWDKLVAKLGLADRGLGTDSAGDALRAIDERIAGFAFDSRDFADIRIDDERVISAAQVRGVVQRFAKRIPVGPRLATLVEEELEEKIYQRTRRLAADEEVQEMVLDLGTDDIYRIFGGPIHPESEKDFRDCAFKYLEDRYEAALEAIRDGQWLRIDRIGMRMLGKQTLSSAEYLYLKMALTGAGNRHARYVMVDEVQDYTPAQLMVLARYFKNAHFLMLGDENQAIRPGTANFDDIRAVFSRLRGGVSECQLNTSYRSSPEITALFSSLMEDGARMQVSSVQRPGTAPVIAAYADAGDYVEALRAAVASARAEGGLAAVLAANAAQVKALSALLGDDAPTVVGRDAALPGQGVVLMELPLAKGLEFDQVVVPDAQAFL
ncbi:MAG: AAA family ATPase, partial [Coriobacteriia bacterium]|nr:AAA family ATPase [Coriobacteriia bacterium]